MNFLEEKKEEIKHTLQKVKLTELLLNIESMMYLENRKVRGRHKKLLLVRVALMTQQEAV